jgi:hypothetical protein
MLLALRPDTDPALDARALFLEGLQHLRQLAGATWTDHNLHDPGITMLELLAYALTDLAYRAGFAVEDLIAAPPGEAGPAAEYAARQFWRARQVLPNAPATLADWRRALIDLPGVRNAWVLPHRVTAYADPRRRELRLSDPGTPGTRAVELQGLFEVKLDFMDAVDTPARRRAVLADVRRVLAAQRALGQVFVAVSEVEVSDIALCAEAEIADDADASQVGAAIVFAWQQQLAPDVPNRSLAEMLARTHEDGRPFEASEVFEGPLLRHGFIAPEDLAASELSSELRLSDLVAATMRVAGVRALRDLTANRLDADGNPLPRPDAWRIALPEGTRARLAPAAGRLVLYKRHTPVLAWSFEAPAPPRLAEALAALREGARRKVETERSEELPLPPGRSRGLARYGSVQRHFPAAYAIGEQPLPSGASDERVAQALQLAAYLLMFDQPMANALAQLEQAHRTLSVDPDALAALAARFAAAPRADLADEPWHQRAQLVGGLRAPAPLDPLVPEDAPLYAPGLRDVDLARDAETRAQSARRWQASLDHLLARSGEDFAGYLAVIHSAFGTDDARAIADRCRFLAEAPRLAAERGLAFDLGLEPEAQWNSANVTGLERRIARLLGIADASRRNLSLLAHDVYPEIDKTPGDEFRWRVRDARSDEILLSASTRYVTREAARAEMLQAVALARTTAGYQRARAEDGRFYFNIVDAGGEVVGRRIEYFADEAARDAAIDALVAAMTRLQEAGEGMYLIEGILLRLVDAADRAAICCDESGSGTDCDDDPFSWRVHFVLPAYAGRFIDMDFRRFAEATIRAETPAHLCPRVCWVGPDDMAAVERAWRDWLALPERVPRAERREKTAALRDALARAKSVYPARQLLDCTSGEETDQPLFVLGRAALGSAPPRE